MNRIVNLFSLLILGFSFIFPAAAIKYAQAQGATVITSQPNTKSFKCIDPIGKKLLCILVVTHVKPPKNTLTCKDPDNHKFKCTYIIINKKYTNNIFHKIVFLYVYLTPKDRKLIYENKIKVVPIFVTKIVVKIIHEHEPSGNVRVVVIREQEDNYRPTVVVINCFAPCFQEEYSRALIQNTIINSPVYITNFNQITNIVNNINTINSVNIIKNNIINNAYLNNVNTDNMNIFNPPPPPAYSPTAIFSLPPDTPIYKGGTTNPNIGSPAITNPNIGSPAITKGTLNLPRNITTNTPSLNKSNTSVSPENNTIPTQNNTIIPPPPPSASNQNPNNTTSNVPSLSQNNTIPTQNNTIIPPPPPSASNQNPNNTTSNVPSLSQNNETSIPSTPSNQQTMTQGCGQGTDNSTCQINQNSTPTPAPRQNTTPNSPVDCNVNPNDPSCPQHNNNSPNQDLGGDNNNNTNGSSTSTGGPSAYSDDYHHHH